MTVQRKYDATVARIAGNIAGTVLSQTHDPSYGEDALTVVAQASVFIARAIVAEVERTEPKQDNAK